MTTSKPNPPTFQELILKLQTFWAQRGCVLQQPYDVEVGAGTMAPETFLRVLGRRRTRLHICSRRGVRPMGVTGRIPTGSSSTRNCR